MFDMSGSSLDRSSTECFGVTKVNVRKCSFTWTITHFTSVHCKRTAIPLESPTFSNANDDFEWYLRLKVNSSYINLGLDYCKKYSEHTPISGVLKLSLLNADNVKSHYQKADFLLINNNGTPPLFENFIQTSYLSNAANRLLVGDVFKVFCELSYVKQKDIEHISHASAFALQTDEPSKSENFQDLEKMFMNEEFSDVIISVGNQNFPAHKNILATRSPVFEAEFKHNMKEKEENRVCIEDIDEEVIKEMLYFMYTGKTKNLNALVWDLLIAADRYDLEELKQKCEKVLLKNLSVENVIKSLIFADTYNAQNLKTQALRFVRIHSPEKDILNRDVSQELLSSCPHLLAEMLSLFVKH